MKRFIKRTDLTSLWEEDGDIERMKAFFHTIKVDSESNKQVKESIKQKALEKIACDKELNRAPVMGNVSITHHICRKLGALSGIRHLKLGFLVIGLVILVTIGQGAMNASWHLPQQVGNSNESTQSIEMTQPVPGTIETSGTQANDGAHNKILAAKDEVTPKKAFSNITPDSSTKGQVTETLPVPPNLVVIPPADNGIPRKITQDLNLTLEVGTVNDAVNLIIREVQQQGGYVVSSQQSGTDNHSSAQMTVKIPVAKFDELRNSLSTWGKVLNQQLLANDITNQYYDSRIRQQTLEAQEKRLVEILNQAKTVDDVLKVENSLGNIRQQIEQLKGQLKLWNNQVDYSTVSLQLVTLQSANVDVKNAWKPISWIKTWKATENAVLKTISSTWNVLNYLVVGIGYAFPYLIIGVLGWGVYRVWKKRKSN
ncbi:DUF4349 domain-containing protein [Desulfosporosinus sp. Sb-LF]|uniref:DUF4349 domain-containing protein n=1 Tax=Desulfosporosinus sp. Sb-LF TaxID=2560027 RepID=UPI00107EFD54|nr:DUF4349 domain-containing protein [Desulfosporosinus sp. Sb-LF]TGE33229.1 DUF4349 domain-containing protein [Desulfosporosinus sp. Sb-LF]